MSSPPPSSFATAADHHTQLPSQVNPTQLPEILDPLSTFITNGEIPSRIQDFMDHLVGNQASDVRDAQSAWAQLYYDVLKNDQIVLYITMKQRLVVTKIFIYAIRLLRNEHIMSSRLRVNDGVVGRENRRVLEHLIRFMFDIQQRYQLLDEYKRPLGFYGDELSLDVRESTVWRCLIMQVHVIKQLAEHPRLKEKIMVADIHFAPVEEQENQHELPLFDGMYQEGDLKLIYDHFRDRSPTALEAHTKFVDRARRKLEKQRRKDERSGIRRTADMRSLSIGEQSLLEGRLNRRVQLIYGMTRAAGASSYNGAGRSGRR